MSNTIYIADFPFHCEPTDKDGRSLLRVEVGQTLVVVQTNGGWSRGYLQSDARKRIGWFPTNIIRKMPVIKRMRG
jgi:hypothetical protein